jgi:hypothetical protein
MARLFPVLPAKEEKLGLCTTRLDTAFVDEKVGRPQGAATGGC